MGKTPEEYAAINMALLGKYLEQKDVKYAELKAIINKKTKVKNKYMKILTLQGEIEYLRRLICNSEYGVYPKCQDVPPSWQKVSSIKRFF